MAYSTQTVTAPNGGAPLSQINLSFNYLDRDEIDVYINEALLSRSAWHFNSATQIELNTGLNNGEVILVKRRTSLSALRHQYSQGAAFRADTLDESLKQVLHIAQEATEANMSGEFFTDINMHGHQISGGNVSLSGNLTVGGEFTASGAGKRLRADFSSATLSNRFCFQSSTTNGNTGVNTIPNGTATVTSFAAFNRSNPDNSGYLRLSCEDTSAQVTAGKTGSGTALPLKMSAGSSPVNLILDSNTLMFGTTSHSPLSYAGGNALSFSCGGAAKIVTHSGTTSPMNVAVFLNPNGPVGFINTDGSSTLYSTSSDYRLKENLRELEDGIDNVLKMKPLRYNWKADGREGIGFIAHELSEIVPEAVTGEKDAVDEEGKIKPQAVDYGRITPYLVKAIQELVEEVNVLKEKINAMEK